MSLICKSQSIYVSVLTRSSNECGHCLLWRTLNLCHCSDPVGFQRGFCHAGAAADMRVTQIALHSFDAILSAH